MNKKDASNTEKADFIDLDKKEFKKKNNRFKNFLLLFFFFLLCFCFFFLYKENTFDFNTGPLSKVKSNNSKIEIANESEDEILNSLKTDLQNNQKKLEDLEIKNNGLTVKINELENILEKFINDPKEIPIEKSNDSEILKKFRAIYALERLQEKFFKNEKFDLELRVINDLFASDKTIIEITTSIKELGDFVFYDQKILLKKLNEIIQLNSVKNDKTILEKDKRILENDKIEISSFSDLLTYLRDLVSSIIVVRKIPEKSNLDIYSPSNDQDSQFINTINSTKDFLIIESYSEALNSIESLNQPLPNNLEEWKKDLSNLISIKDKFEILNNEILRRYEGNDQNL